MVQFIQRMENKAINEESNYINFLRILLIIGVVFTHSAITVPLPHDYTNLTYNIVFFQQEVLGEFRVPTFFLLSGYFFYKKVGTQFCISDYRKKLRRRYHSLLLPYLLWSTMALCLKLLYTTLFKEQNINFADLLLSYIFYNGNIVYPFPINGPLWYIRDLILIIIITPILFALIRYLKITLITFLVISFIFLPYWEMPLSLLYTGIVWFSVGAYISISSGNKNILYYTDKLHWLYFVYPLLVIINIFSRGMHLHEIFMQLTVTTGVFFHIKIFYIIYQKTHLNHIKLNTGGWVMFIYCSHFIVDYIKPIYGHLIPHVHLILTHFCIAITTLVICTVSYFTLQKLFPGSLKYLIGDR